jgi:nucleoside-diphosphate-sugar epimerase
MMFKDARVLVTGGAGFIGSGLVRLLLEQGAKVRVADNLSRGSMDNLNGLEDRVEFMKLDLTNQENCLTACKGIEYVFHLAASVGGIHFIKQENVGGSTPSLLMNTSMLEAARKCDVLRFLFASSACVYRERSLDLNRFSEEDAYPANPATTYGWAKLMGEIQCRSYFLDYGVKMASPRIFNAFGERESLDPKSAHVIPSLIRKALVYPREKFAVFGDGKQERAFLYVHDCAEGLLRCVEKIEDGSPVNLGSEEIVSIDHVARQVIALSGKDVKIEYDLSGPQGTHRYCADTAKMRSVLEWWPRTAFLTGLRNTFDWAKRKVKVAG